MAEPLPEPEGPAGEPPPDPAAARRFFPVRVAEVVAETPEAHSLVLDPPPEPSGRFRYRPGQYLTLRIPSERPGTVARCYSLSSSPYERGRPRITVKRTDGGYASNWICDRVAPGTTLEVMPPAGQFTPGDLDADLLLLAGGSGITPVMSIARSALARGRGRVSLVYANRDASSVIFADDLSELQRAHPERLAVLHWLETLQGVPDLDRLRGLLRPFADRDTFVCGPDAFMGTATRALRSLGLPPRRLHVERFMSLADEPPRGTAAGDAAAAPGATAAPPGETAAPPGTSGGGTDASPDAPADGPAGGVATVEVELDGAVRRLSWPAGQKLLDLLLEQGVDAPYSCRQGQCSACACRLREGEIDMLHNEVLEEGDFAEGYILACQSVPISDSVSVTYD